jgi:hypothetical protein
MIRYEVKPPQVHANAVVPLSGKLHPCIIQDVMSYLSYEGKDFWLLQKKMARHAGLVREITYPIHVLLKIDATPFMQGRKNQMVNALSLIGLANRTRMKQLVIEGLGIPCPY